MLNPLNGSATIAQALQAISLDIGLLYLVDSHIVCINRHCEQLYPQNVELRCYIHGNHSTEQVNWPALEGMSSGTI